MTFKQQMEETRESVSQIACWCLTVALHQEFGVGAQRLECLAERMNELEETNIRTMMREGTRAADKQRADWIGGKAELAFPVPLLRAPRGRKEQQLRMAGDEAAAISWQLFAAACIDCLGFGAERLAKLKQEGRKNYEQINWESHEDGLEVAMEHLKRCAEAALRQECQVVEKDPGDWEQYKRELLAAERVAVRAGLSSMRAARNPCPRADAEKERIFRRAMEETLSLRRA